MAKNINRIPVSANDKDVVITHIIEGNATNYKQIILPSLHSSTVQIVTADFIFDCNMVNLLSFICYRLSVEFKIKQANIKNTVY
jgi:hypothetical protein